MSIIRIKYKHIMINVDTTSHMLRLSFNVVSIYYHRVGTSQIG